MSLRRLLPLALLVLALLTASGSAQAQDGGPIYVVLEGDTLIGIASRFGTTAEALAVANSLADPSAIFPGMRLLIPGFEGVSGVLATRPVEAGESLQSISLRHRSASSSLARLNRLVNPARLYVGQPLIVPVDEAAPSPLEVALVLPGEAAGLISLAAEADSNPWVVAGLNGRPMDLWRTAGDPVFLPSSEPSLDALPDGWTSLSLRPERPGQGHTLAVRADVAGLGEISGSLGEMELHFAAEEEGPSRQVALQGIHVLTEPGLVDLVLTYSPSGDPEISFAFVQPVRIEEEDYGREAIRVPPETIDPANTVPEDAQIAAVVGVATPERLWNGPFQFPTDYYELFPSFFGTRRNYNEMGFNYYHTGLDLYGSSKTEVRAPAPGVVAFAALLTVRGNTTYIDHGWGVYTGYLHQSQIFVEPGDRVETGDLIGMVGGTGRVTGPHLHWEVWVGGVPVQPLEWTGSVWP